jgi:hypothetical protein
MAKNTINSEFGSNRGNNLYLYTKGGIFSLDGKEYVGEFHYVGMQPKTGPIPTPEAKILHRLYTNSNHYDYDRLLGFEVPILEYVDPKPYLYRPDEQAYVVGFDSRFFVERYDDPGSYAIEIDQDQFDRINVRRGIDGGLYQSARIKWQLIGSQEGIVRHNELELYNASKLIPTINYSVRNFSEFARINLV